MAGIRFQSSDSEGGWNRGNMDSRAQENPSQETPFYPQVELVTVSTFLRPPINTWAKHTKGAESLNYPGGSFSGPLLNGTVLEAMVTGRYFAEQQLIRIVAHHKMLTEDGVVIHATDSGAWRGSDNAISRLMTGELVALSQYYFIGLLRYSVSDRRYAWLEKGVYLSRGKVDGNKLEISHFRALNPTPLARGV
jgi:Protein of unknown function (DUF3237)